LLFKLKVIRLEWEKLNFKLAFNFNYSTITAQ